MSSKRFWLLISLLIVVSLAFAACQPTTPATQEPQTQATEPPAAEEPAATEPAAEEPVATEPAAEEPAAEEGLIFGMLLVGPYNDHGYSEAHYNGGLYVQDKLPGSEMLYIDKVNPADRPGTTPAQLAEDLVSKGAKIVVFNSDDMKDSAIEFAQNHPDIWTIHASGDSAWEEGKDFQNLPNMINPMGRMEYGKMIAGCAAALTTQTGQIGYLGPLINDETRRLTASAYLGARYCWEEYLGNDVADLQFRVNW
ncbi:MAG TPA: BMP family ABC transporter substrate-binding protein, partial [Anaerolineaceae bacterium]|nr:BMP family ABC transporter substrate-binding protein [Anaerolineaceae bacterium]